MPRIQLMMQCPRCPWRVVMSWGRWTEIKIRKAYRWHRKAHTNGAVSPATALAQCSDCLSAVRPANLERHRRDRCPKRSGIDQPAFLPLEETQSVEVSASPVLGGGSE